MTIYQIKRLTQETSPFYFKSKTMKVFGQTLRSFSVKKQLDGRFLISAPIFDRFTDRKVGQSVRYFNPENNKLEYS